MTQVLLSHILNAYIDISEFDFLWRYEHRIRFKLKKITNCLYCQF